jgi:hypothetical protein
MKIKWVLFLLGTLAVIWFTGCSDDSNGKPGFNGNSGNNGGNNQTNTTNAPLSLTGVTINHTITSATASLPSTGSFRVQLTGTPGSTSGDFRTFEPGGTETGAGTFTSALSNPNTAVLVFVDPLLGTVTEELVFFTTNSGTFIRNVGSGESQQGTFVFQ